MKKRMVVATVLAVLVVASACAQTTDIFTLVEIGTPQDVQAAIDKGADVNARNYIGSTPLMIAAMTNPHPEVITTLLKAGADIEARDPIDGATALLWAAWGNSNPGVTATLLNAGADINARTTFGMTALIEAAYAGANPAEVITVLLDADADARAKDTSDHTALDYGRSNAKLKGTNALRKLEEASK